MQVDVLLEKKNTYIKLCSSLIVSDDNFSP